MARFVIDQDRSVVEIEARSSLHPIHSESRGLEGFLDLELDEPAGGDGATLNPDSPPTGHLELSVDRLESGNPLYDREMRRRIDARRFPLITGDLASMTPAGRPAAYRVAGDVTFRGVRLRCEDEMTLSATGEDELELRGTHVFDVRDFGLDPPKIMMLRVHPEVRVSLRLIARRAP